MIKVDRPKKTHINSGATQSFLLAMESLSFSELLRQGRIAEAVDLRIEALEKMAHDYQVEMEVAKALSLGLSACTVAIVAAPVVAFIGMGGLLAYGAVLLKDTQVTHQFCPLPLLRKNPLEMFAAIGSIQETPSDRLRKNDDDEPFVNPLERVMRLLPPKEAIEYAFLHYAESKILPYCRITPPEYRAQMYVRLLRNFRLGMDFPSLSEMQDEMLGYVTEDARAIASSTPDRLPPTRIQMPYREEPPYVPGVPTVIQEDEGVREAIAYTTPATPPAARSYAPTSQDSTLFDWSRIADPDECPKLGIVGKMNAGKSRLIKYLAKYVLFPGEDVDAVVFDVFGRKWEWEGFKVFSEYPEMISQMASDLKEINNRKAQFLQGVDNFRPMFRLMEEAKDTLPSLQRLNQQSADILDDWQEKHGSLTRKLRSRACYVSTDLTAGSFGMSADSRNDLTIIFPGEKGIAKAMNDTRMLKLGSRDNAKLRGELRLALHGVDRPALVFHDGEWYAAKIPTLDASGNPEGHPKFNPNFKPVPQAIAPDHPETTPAPPRPQAAPAESPLVAIAQWVEQIRYIPTDEELSLKYFQLTGQELNAEGLQIVRAAIDGASE